jgi:hypothetical protein
VSSRQAEKEKRRQERLAKEAEAAKAARQRRIMGYAAGGVLGVAAVAAIVIALMAGGGDGGSEPKPSIGEGPKVPIPARQASDLQQAARAAGCTVRSFVPAANDRNHVNGTVQYKQNPPVFGPHNQQWASDGDYVGQGAPQTEMVVHALEHSRVVIWYKPSLPQRRIQQLETLFAEPIEGQQEGYKQLLVERPNMPPQVAATAWGQQLSCPQFNDRTFDAIRAFRARYVDKGPENPPFPE